MAQAVGTLIEAARTLEERAAARVVIVGDGAERAELEARRGDWG